MEEGLWFSLGLGKGEGHSRKRLEGKEAESEQAAVRAKDPEEAASEHLKSEARHKAT